MMTYTFKFITNEDNVDNQKTSDNIDVIYYVADKNWNDYGIINNFLVYLNTVDNNHYIGNVKLYVTTDDYNICDKLLKSKKANFYQIGENKDFYLNLSKLNNAREFLTKSHDVIYKPELLDKINDQYFKDKSFLRDDGVNSLSDLLNIRKFAETYDKFLDILKNLDNNPEKIFELLNDQNESESFTEKCINADSFYKENTRKLIIVTAKYVLDNNKKDFSTGLTKLFDESVDAFKNDNEVISLVGKILSKKSREVIKLVDEIKDILRVEKDDYDKKPFSLGQYTSLGTISKLIFRANFANKNHSHPVLRLTNAHQMNDPLEGKVILNYLIPEENNDEDYNFSNIYVSSATSSLDNLPMWKQYADNASGICLIYNHKFIKDILQNQNIKIYRVAYLDDKKDLNIKVAKVQPSEKFDASTIESDLKEIKNCLSDKRDKGYEASKRYVNLIEYLFKRDSYSYENEFRIIMDLSYTNDPQNIFVESVRKYPIPFVFTLARNDDNQLLEPKYYEIKLGPKCLDVDYVGPYVKYCNNKIKISLSRISYR